MSSVKTFRLLALASALVVVACKKEAATEQPAPSGAAGYVTAVGTPDGTPVSKNIGAAGGTLTSADGQIRIDVPAGALAGNQSITVQPITNHTPAGVRKAYRLTPHGLQFSKPVTLTFAYTANDLQGTVAEALGIAYQNKDGIWLSVNAAKVNKSNKTVSVTTTHFSDWSLFEAFSIVPMDTTALVGTNVNLKVVHTVPDEDLLVQIAPGSESPLSQQKDFEAAYVKKWTLTGEGILSSRDNKALYTAPAQVPQDNPVEVSVSLDLKQKGQFIIIARITIIDDEKVVISAGAGPGGGAFTLARVPQAMHVRSINRTRLSAYIDGSTTNDSKHVEFTFPSATGVYSWNRNGNITAFYTVRKAGNNTVYNSFWADNIRWYDSPGNITITHYGAVGEHITGTFTIQKSGYSDNLKTTTTVTGKFSVMRLDDVAN